MNFKTQSDRPNIKDNLGVVIDIVLKLITRLDNESKISLCCHLSWNRYVWVYTQ